MSTERIDHIAEARRLQEVARGIISDQPTAFAPHMGAVIMLDEARLEAQLAIAEGQRIANLIAYVQLLESQYAEAAKHADEFDWETRADSVARHGVALDRIREGLGL